MYSVNKHFQLKHYLSATFILALLTACAYNKAIYLYPKPPEESVPANNIATLTVPIEIDLVYVDGKKTSFLPPYQPYVRFKLLPGKHVYGFQYQDMVLNEDGNEESIRSGIVIIRFHAEAGKKYTIDFNRPTTYAETLKLETFFEITLNELPGEQASGPQKTIARSFPAPESPWPNGFNTNAFSLDATDIFDENQQNHTSNKPPESAPPEQHLIYWWGEASEKARTDFKHWIEQHP